MIRSKLLWQYRKGWVCFIGRCPSSSCSSGKPSGVFCSVVRPNGDTKMSHLYYGKAVRQCNQKRLLGPLMPRQLHAGLSETLKDFLMTLVEVSTVIMVYFWFFMLASGNKRKQLLNLRSISTHNLHIECSYCMLAVSSLSQTEVTLRSRHVNIEGLTSTEANTVRVS